MIDDKIIIENKFNTTTGSDQPLSAFFTSNNIDLVAGQFYKLKITYAEKLGLTKLKLFWESDSQEFEIISSDQLYNLLNSQYTPYLFTVIPAVTNETKSFLGDLQDASFATVNVEETNLIYARDKFGNP